MRALIIVDRLFAQHERAMIERTAIGLLDEDVETRLVIPDLGEFETTRLGVLIPQIKYKDRGLSFTLKIRVMNIVRALDAGRGTDHQWDIIHAFGGQSWSLAYELARALDSALVLELWRAGLITRAAGFARNCEVPYLFTAPDHSIERAASSAGVRLPIHVAPWGVPVPQKPRAILEDGKSVSIVFHSSGRNRAECVTAFDGVLDAIGDRGDIHLFVNLQAIERAGLWARAKKANMLGALTIIDRIEDQRELALNADLLVYPDTVHEHRSFLLEAMANGLCVVAATAGQCSTLIDDETASIVHKLNQTQWRDKVQSLIMDPANARRIGMNAWTHIRDQRKVSTHIGATTDAYARLLPAASGMS